MSGNVDLDPWAAVVGQPELVRRLQAAVDNPVHAYLLVGPPGAGTRAAALAFAGDLLARDDPSGGERHRRLAATEQHPDVYILDPTGNQLRRDEEAEPLIVEASRSPIEGDHKVLLVDRFHTATPASAAALLKTIEEPPATAVFVLLAEDVPPEHVTIASRCIRIDVPPVPTEVVRDALIADGVGADVAEVAAAGAAGNLDRARDLAHDPAVATRQAAWWSIPDRLDGTGAAVAVCVEEVRSLIDDALAAVADRHGREMEELAEREERLGTRGSGRRDLEARHKRELRQIRTQEIQFGLRTLAARYREAIDADPAATGPLDAIERMRGAGDALIRNPNEALFLQALLLDLPTL